jgi:TetR/AcrR family transcriptional regulator, mexJK operon transcriptional repressor
VITAAVEAGRSARKRRAIMDAARTLFLRKGYAGTSMDDVAALAAVSKQTVYKNFADKRQLFTEFIGSDIAHVESSTHALIDQMPETENLESDLREFARRHLADVMQPHLLQMRRVLIGEAERFPDLAQAWYTNGPERSCGIFAGWFEALDRRGLLRTPDPMLAAQHFNWLVLSIPVNKAMASPSDQPLFTRAELDHYADEAVRVFLAAYSVTPANESSEEPQVRN